MQQRNYPFTFLIVALLLLALTYVLEVNRVSEAQAEIKSLRMNFQRLSLDYQEAREKLTSLSVGNDFELLQEELKLIEVKGFSFLEPKPSQFSLNTSNDQS